MTQKLNYSSRRLVENTLIIWGVFILDCFLGNLANIFISGRAETQEEWLKQIQLYNLGKSVFSWTPYIILLLFNNRKFDMIDKLMIFICLITCWINTADWIMNFNWRSDILEWFVFPASLLFLTVVKFLMYKKTG